MLTLPYVAVELVITMQNFVVFRAAGLYVSGNSALIRRTSSSQFLDRVAELVD